MRVIQINCGEKGSIGRVMSSIEAALNARKDISYVFYGLGLRSKVTGHKKITMHYENGIYRRISYATGVRFGFAPIATVRMIQEIKRIKPDIVHIHCINGSMVNVYRLIHYICKNNIPLVVTNHCEMFYTANCDHSYNCEKWKNGCGNCEYLKKHVGPFFIDGTARSWRKMKWAFIDGSNVSVTSVSKWIYDRSTVSPITGRFANYIIENGLDVTAFANAEQKKEQVAKKYAINTDKKIILFVTSHFEKEEDNNKGGYFFLKLAELLKNDGDICLIVVGTKGNENFILDNVVNIGRVDCFDELVSLYALAHLTIVLSKKETYSMPCAESLCSGTPVVGFKAGGPESISITEYSAFCEYGDLQTLYGLIKKWIDVKEANSKEIMAKAVERYDSKVMTHMYLGIYDSMLSKTN